MPAHSSDYPVLARLLDQNAQWADDVRAAEPDFFESCVKGQAPKVLWLGCADSRCPESTMLAAKPGEVFVHRNIANQFPPTDDSANAVLAYGVGALGCEHVVIVGHYGCGGVNAAIAASASGPTGPAGSALERWLQPMTTLAYSLEASHAADPEAAHRTVVDENVKAQVENVLATDVIRDAWAAGKEVVVHGWVYDIGTGKIKDLGVARKPPAKA